MDLGIVRAAIAKKKVPHYEFAKQLGVHPATLSRFLNGKTVLRSEELMKLMSLLKIKPEALMRSAS